MRLARALARCSRGVRASCVVFNNIEGRRDRFLIVWTAIPLLTAKAAGFGGHLGLLIPTEDPRNGLKELQLCRCFFELVPRTQYSACVIKHRCVRESRRLLPLL